MDIKQGLQTILLIDKSYSKYIEDFSSVGKTHSLIITPFDNVYEGLAYLQEYPNEIDAVLLDLSFTQNNYEGVEALKQIKKTNKLLPVIMLSNSQSEKDMRMAVSSLREGAFNYVVKTNFDLVSLFHMLKVAITQFQSNIELERYIKLREEFRTKISVFEKMMFTSEMILKNILNSKLLFPPTFERRVKDFHSFYEKILKKEKSEGFIEYPFKRISDIAGLRVIFYNADDLQKAVEVLQESNDFVDFNKGGNLIPDDKSKSYGYRAVHFDVILNPNKRLQLQEYQQLEEIPCEVQFKTIFAHSWSKVYHTLAYKETGEIKLTEDGQIALDKDFRTAAMKLEDIEKQITDLCAKYYLK